MIKKIVFAAALGCAAFTNGFAGGILTNTNQNVAFLRNPARDGAIGIDGTYSNPAGVAFLDEGTHLSINWQAAWQTRSIDTWNPVFGPIPDDNDKGYKGYLGNKDFNGQPQTYEGKASAPFIPSVQAAYNKDRWSFQFNFSWLFRRRCGTDSCRTESVWCWITETRLSVPWRYADKGLRL